MPKWIKFIVAILLLPVCGGAAQALWLALCASGRADVVWVPLLAGAACWLVIFLLLPKPMWLYVFGHELTHALWTWLFGGQVKKMKVSSEGGHVVVSKTNFVIALAPYFFLATATQALRVSIGVTLSTLFIFGFIKARFTGASPFRSAIQTLVIGGVAAAAAYALAKAVS